MTLKWVKCRRRNQSKNVTTRIDGRETVRLHNSACIYQESDTQKPE